MTAQNIKIEKGVPMPTDRVSYKPSLMSTMRAMKVGDSIVLPQVRQATVRMTASHLGYKIKQRKIEGVQDCRFWRVS